MKAAIISREGLGDAILMMIFSHHLKNNGYEIIFFHKVPHLLKPLFEYTTFKNYPKKKFLNIFSQFDLIIVENFKHETVDFFKKNKNKFKNLFFIYTNLKKNSKNEISFSKNFSMAKNITLACEKILKIKNLKKRNNIKISKNLIYRNYKKRIIIHPFSNDKKKNWRIRRYVSLYKKLKSINFNPIFILSKKEKFLLKNFNVKYISFSNYKDLSEYIYESYLFIGNDSGPAHLASCLKIPTVVIASNKRAMNLWRPDFFKNILITAPDWIPNFKFFRIKKYFWSFFISKNKIIKKIYEEDFL